MQEATSVRIVPKPSKGTSLCYFPAGPPPTTLTVAQSSKRPRLLLQHEVEEETGVHFLHGDAESFRFEGTEIRGDRFILGVWHPSSRELELHSDTILFSMAQQVRTDRARAPPARADLGTGGLTGQAEYQAQAAKLTEDFGARISKQLLQKRENNRVTADKLVAANTGSVMTTMLEHRATEQASRADLDQQLAEQRQLPPFDASTTEPTAIYPLAGILTLGAWAALDGSIGELDRLDADARLQALYSRTARTAFSLAQTRIADDPMKNLRLKRLGLLLDVLIALHALPAKKVRSQRDVAKALAGDVGLDAAIVQELTQLFYESMTGADGAERLEQRSELRQRLRNYISIVCVLAFDCLLDTPVLENLARDTNQTEQKTRAMLAAVGCTSKTKRKRDAQDDESKRFVCMELKAPLVLPPLVRAGRAKRN